LTTATDLEPARRSQLKPLTLANRRSARKAWVIPDALARSVTMMAKPKLPASLAEAEAAVLKAGAVAYARELVRMIRDQQISFCGLRLSWFEKPDSQRLAGWLAKQMAETPQGMVDLCNLARAGWGLADEAARELIQDYKHRRRYEDMPPSLLAYDQEITGPRRAYRRLSSQKKEDHFLCDLAITCVVGAVCVNTGLKATRQRASKPSKRDRFSACRVTAEALRLEQVAERLEGRPLGESGVAEIWRRLGHIAFPNGPRALRL
jgi:hypothetical protein